MATWQQLLICILLALLFKRAAADGYRHGRATYYHDNNQVRCAAWQR